MIKPPKNTIPQEIAKKTIDCLLKVIQPGITETQIVKIAEKTMIENGIDNFWYYNIGAFVFVGERTLLSISGRDYQPTEEMVKENDVITIDLSPSLNGYWGDYAGTIIIENNTPSILSPSLIQYVNKDIDNAKTFLNDLHTVYPTLLHQEKTMDEIYEEVNHIIRKKGFENLDFAQNIGHTIEKRSENRRYFDSKTKIKLKELEIFTFEPHIKMKDSKFGYKREDIYFKTEDGFQLL